jgi:4-hydroxy-tetrahydrodipicolinate synthase
MINNTKSPFGSLITAMATPFEENYSIDFKAAENIVDHLVTTGSESVVINGTTGESPTIEDTELKLLFRFAKDKCNGKLKFIAGVGSNSTKKTIKLANVAESCGADGLLVVMPYYNKPSQAGLVKHLQEVAKNTSTPIIIYNIPGRTGVNLGVEATLEVIETCPSIIGLKDSTNSVEQSADIARLVTRKDFFIYSGDDFLTLPFLSIGAAGIVSVASHLVGSQIKVMLDSYFKGDFDQARKIHYTCLPLFKGLFAAPSPTCLKYGLSKIGLCKNVLRMPLIPLTAGEQAKFDAIFNQSPIDKPKAAIKV